MKKAKITLFQLYTMMTLFGLGTSSILGLGMVAKQDAWIAVLLASVGGAILFLMYGYIFIKYPETPYTQTLEKILSKPIGKFISLLYIVYFMYIATLVLRDIGELVCLYVLSGTPMLVINLLAVLVIMYALYLGIEPVVRTGEIFFFFVLTLFTLLMVLLILTGVTDFKNLLPVLEKGWKPVIKAAFPLLLAFPFGEHIAFMMVLHHVNKKGAIKVSLLSIITTSILMTILTIMNIASIGVYLTEHSTFPTIETLRLINVGEIIQRIDSFAVIILMIGGIGKTIIYLYAASTAITSVFTQVKYNYTIIPVTLVVLIGSIVVPDFTTHIYIGLRIVPYFINFPMEVVIPFLVIIVILIKQFFKKNKRNKKERV